MKIIYSLKNMLFFSMLLGTISIYSQVTPSSPAKEKYYINPEAIFINKDSIYVNLNHEWLAINSLHKDQNGLYINPSDDLITWTYFYPDNATVTIKCDECDHENYYSDTYCIKCGHDLYSSSNSKTEREKSNLKEPEKQKPSKKS